MDRLLVADPADASLDGFRGLRDPDLRRSVEARDGLFVAEGTAVVGRLVRKGAHARLVLSVDLIGQAVSVEVDAADVKAY